MSSPATKARPDLVKTIPFTAENRFDFRTGDKEKRAVVLATTSSAVTAGASFFDLVLIGERPDPEYPVLALQHDGHGFRDVVGDQRRYRCPG